MRLLVGAAVFGRAFGAVFQRMFGSCPSKGMDFNRSYVRSSGRRNSRFGRPGAGGGVALDVAIGAQHFRARVEMADEGVALVDIAPGRNAGRVDRGELAALDGQDGDAAFRTIADGGFEFHLPAAVMRRAEGMRREGRRKRTGSGRRELDRGARQRLLQRPRGRGDGFPFAAMIPPLCKAPTCPRDVDFRAVQQKDHAA